MDTLKFNEFVNEKKTWIEKLNWKSKEDIEKFNKAIDDLKTITDYNEMESAFDEFRPALKNMTTTLKKKITSYNDDFNKYYNE